MLRFETSNARISFIIRESTIFLNLILLNLNIESPCDIPVKFKKEKPCYSFSLLYLRRRKKERDAKDSLFCKINSFLLFFFTIESSGETKDSNKFSANILSARNLTYFLLFRYDSHSVDRV